MSAIIGEHPPAPHAGRSTGGQAPPYVVVRETHSAFVLLIGTHAYKFKKDMVFDFLDFSTRERRAVACRREVELNRRLAPDVYEGTGEVRGPDGGSIESFVLMRRMPEEGRLARLVQEGHDVDDALRAVARLVVDFHERCRRGPDIAASGRADAVAARWRHNIDEARPFRGSLLPAELFDRVAVAGLRYVVGRADLFDDRIARGAVVDGHGDLLADDIFCLPDGPRILDCLDFDDALRHLDRVDDIACLVMDLERLGAPEPARLLREHYLELSGDSAPASLVDHYIAYRAFMRAKVVCLQATRPEEERAAEANRLLEIAAHHLPDVALVIVGGAPGTGKTTLACALADAMGAVVVSSDRVRKELVGLAPEASARAAFARGIYAPEMSERTYEELVRRASALLARGESVVLDATWSQAERRRAAAQAAAATSSSFVALRCDVTPDVAEHRVTVRSPGASDADADVARRVRRDFDPWPEAASVDTGGPVAASLAQALRAVGVAHGVVGA